jgi:hypothetical protein
LDANELDEEEEEVVGNDNTISSISD